MEKLFWHALINLCSGIYDLICYVFDIFYYLCGLQLFTDSDYTTIVQKVYIILGLVMMFVLAYSLLKAVINPEQFAKGETSFPKLVQNIVVSLIIIAVLPTVFNVAFNVQNSILKYEVIPKLILGETDAVDASDGSAPKIMADGVSVSGGRAIAYYTFKSFLVPNEEDCMENNETCRSKIESTGNVSLSDADTMVLGGKTFGYYATFDKAVAKDQLSFNFLIALVAGIFVLYVLLNFCFDMALRVIKLAFYQIIAPIPVICRIIPGGKLKDVFSKWLKQVISLFVEVFVRIAALTLGVYLIALIVKKYDAGLTGISTLSWGQKNIVLALLIMSVVMFIKQIPKLIGDLFGLDTGGMKLGLMDKLAAGGGLMAASVAGAGADMFLKNGVNAVKNFHDTKGQGFWKRAGAAAKGVGSTVAGTVSGQVRAGMGSRKAKNFGDVKKSVVSASDAAVAKRDKRANYVAQHGGIGGAIFGHMEDTVVSVGEHFGINSSEALIKDNETIANIESKKKAVKTAAESLIVGEGAKGKSKNFGLQGMATFSYTDSNGVKQTKSLQYDTLLADNMKKNMEVAKASGAANAIDLEREYNAYLDAFTKAVQNQAGMGKTSFDAMLSGMSASDALELRADLSEVMDKELEFREEIEKNIDKPYIKESGFTLDMLDRDKALDYTSGAVKDMGDILSVQRNENNKKIRNREAGKKNN